MMKKRSSLFSSFFSMLWLASMLCAVWSGLLHLPLAVRYGLVRGWHGAPSVAHYWSAAALLMLGTYALLVWKLHGRTFFCLTRCGCVRILLLAMLALTGLALVVHNMPDYSIYGGYYAVVKLLHLFCALALLPLLVLRLYREWRGKHGWIRPVEDHKNTRPSCSPNSER